MLKEIEKCEIQNLTHIFPWPYSQSKGNFLEYINHYESRGFSKNTPHENKLLCCEINTGYSKWIFLNAIIHRSNLCIKQVYLHMIRIFFPLNWWGDWQVTFHMKIRCQMWKENWWKGCSKTMCILRLFWEGYKWRIIILHLSLTHFLLVPHICVRELGQHRFR